MSSLDPLFRPRSIAIIGASGRTYTIGNRIMQNLERYGFRGAVVPVNPKGGEILGKKVYASILDVPGEIDMVHEIVRNKYVAPTLEDCAAKGVKVAIVNTSGFKETGARGAELEQQLVEIGRRTGLRIFGPNCQGVMNSDPAVSLYSNFTFATLRPGHVSIVAQGGGVAEVINNYFGMNDIGQRMYASNGNACDISIPELIEYYGQDEQTHVIVLHIESFADPQEFLRRVAPVAAKKPVLALKSGTTPEGARAVSSHTGGMMAEDTVSQVLFDRCGVLSFASLGELCEAAEAFATQPVPRGNRVGMVTNAGSPAIIVTDEAIKAGLAVPPLAEESKALLADKLQAIASIANPIDMMATAGGDEFGTSLQALLQDPGLDAAVICFMTPFFVDTLGISAAVERLAASTDKTMIAVAMTNPDETPEWKRTVEQVRAAGLPVYYFPEAAARVLSHMDRYRRLRDRPAEPAPALEIDRAAAEAVLAAATPRPDGFLPAAAVSQLLKAYGLPLVAERRAADWPALREAAQQLGYPVVLKAEAPALVHKSDAGAVVVGLQDEAQLEAAWRALADKLTGYDELNWLLQRMAPAGLEVIVGGARAQGLGSMVMFGLGGVHVEVFKDAVFKLAPLTADEPEQMMSGIAATALLDGVRGQHAVDRATLADVLLRTSQLLCDFPQIAELDMNPVLAYPQGRAPCVVDARIKVQD